MLIIWALLLCMPLVGQYSEDNKIHYTVNDGLPSSTCYDIVQDDRGFLWIATEGGLTKFDGYNFKTFTTTNGLVDNEVVKLEKDEHGRIWLNTNRELSYMQNDSFYIHDPVLNSTLNWNFKLQEDDHGLLWVARVNTLNAYDAITLEPKEIDSFGDPDKRNCFILGTHDDALWVAFERTIYKFSGTQLVDSIPFHSYSQVFSHYNSFFQVESPYLYYKRDDEMRRFHLDERSDSLFFKVDGKIRQFSIDQDQAWLLTENSLNHIQLDDLGTVASSNKMLDGELCSRFFFDDKKNLWAGLYKNGLMMFPPTNSKMITMDFDSYGSNNLESVVRHNGKLILGSEKGDLYFVDDDKVTTLNLQASTAFPVDRVIDIVPVSDNEYIVSADSGIHFVKEGNTRELVKTNGKNIFLKGDRLLINCYNGLYEISKDKLLKPNFKSGSADKILNRIRNKRSYTSIIDKENTIWNANVIEGLTKISQTDTFYFKSLSNVFNCTISRLIEMENGLICAVTKGEGLILIKDKTFKQINLKNGLSSDFCYDVCSHGNSIYIATNKGASIIELKDFEKLDFTVTVIDMHDGLSSNEVQDLEYYDGQLYLATNSGMVKYDLQGVMDKADTKQIFVEEFLVNGEQFPVEDSYSLGAHENNIRIKYISPDIAASKNTIYAYRLEGIDEEWITTTSTETHYSNLMAGTYKFQYKHGLADHSKEEVKSIRIKIEPKFVESSMFKFLILSGIGFLFLIPLYFSYHSQKQNLLTSLVKKKSTEVEEKMKLLELSNSRLVSSNKELEQFAYIASHDLQEPINTIKGFGEILKTKFDKEEDAEAIKMLDIISNSSSRMKTLVKDLLVFSRIGKEKQRSMIDMNDLMQDIMNDMTDRIKTNGAQVNWKDLPYTLGYRVELRSLFQNLLSNAMKFQREGVAPIIDITARETDTGFEFSVKDNGIGIGAKHKERIFEIFQRLHNKDEYEGTGIGLAHCKKIVTLHNGNIWVESELGNGCNFKFTIEV